MFHADALRKIFKFVMICFLQTKQIRIMFLDQFHNSVNIVFPFGIAPHVNIERCHRKTFHTEMQKKSRLKKFHIFLKLFFFFFYYFFQNGCPVGFWNNFPIFCFTSSIDVETEIAEDWELNGTVAALGLNEVPWMASNLPIRLCAKAWHWWLGLTEEAVDILNRLGATKARTMSNESLGGGSS